MNNKSLLESLKAIRHRLRWDWEPCTIPVLTPNEEAVIDEVCLRLHQFEKEMDEALAALRLARRDAHCWYTAFENLMAMAAGCPRPAGLPDPPPGEFTETLEKRDHEGL